MASQRRSMPATPVPLPRMVFRQLVHRILGQGSRGAMLPLRAASALPQARNCAILANPLCGAQAPPTWMRSSSCCVLEVLRYASTSLVSTASRAASSFCCSSQCFFSDLYLISRSAGGAEVQARGAGQVRQAWNE